MISLRAPLAKHPAKYSKEILQAIAAEVLDCDSVCDPQAGTCGIFRIRDYGYKKDNPIYAIEIENEFIDYSLVGRTANNIIYNQDCFKFFEEPPIKSVDAIATSVSYGNRMADKHEAKDKSKRITYRHLLGRKLSENNSGGLQYGEKYRQFHIALWNMCLGFFKKKLILNISNHIRGGIEQMVSEWHLETLLGLGLRLEKHIKIPTKRMKFGKNADKRVSHENIFVLLKV